MNIHSVVTELFVNEQIHRRQGLRDAFMQFLLRNLQKDVKFGNEIQRSAKTDKGGGQIKIIFSLFIK
jgi:hypothetical protein